MITGKANDKKSTLIFVSDFRHQTQSTSFISNPNRNNIEANESTPPIKVRESSISNNSTLIPCFIKPVPVPTQTSRISPGTQKNRSYLKCRHLMIIPLMQLIIILRTLQHYHFLHLNEF